MNLVSRPGYHISYGERGRWLSQVRPKSRDGGPKSHETHMIHRRWLIALFLFCFAIASPAAAEFAGKVVGVSDGDTMTVLRDRTQIRI